MTKAKMIETIQQREAELWLKMKEYAYLAAPLHDGYDAFMTWEDTDQHIACLRYEWCALWELMETLGIKMDYENPLRCAASEIDSEIWKLTHAEEIA